MPTLKGFEAIWTSLLTVNVSVRVEMHKACGVRVSKANLNSRNFTCPTSLYGGRYITNRTLETFLTIFRISSSTRSGGGGTRHDNPPIWL